MPSLHADRSINSATGYLLIVNGISAGLGLAQGLVAAAILGPVQLGLVAIITGIHALTLNFLDVRLTDLAAKLYYQSDDDPHQQRRHRAGIIYLCVLGNCFVAVVLVVVGTLLAVACLDWFTETSVPLSWIMMAAAASATAHLTSTLNFLQRFSGRFFLMGTGMLISRVVATIVFLWMVIAIPNVNGYFTGMVLAAIVGLLAAGGMSLLLWYRYDKLPFFRCGLLKAFAVYRHNIGFMIYGNFLGYGKMLHRVTDILFIAYFSDDHVTGIYKLARALTDKLYIIYDALNQVCLPQLLKFIQHKNHDDYRRLARQMLGGSLAVTAGVVIGEFLLLPQLLQWLFADKFAGAHSAIIVLTLPFALICGFHLWVWPGFISSGRLKAFTLATFVACMVQYGIIILAFRMFEPSAAIASVGYLAYYLVLTPWSLLLLRKEQPGLVEHVFVKMPNKSVE